MLSSAQWRSGLVVSLSEALATRDECAVDEICSDERRVRRGSACNWSKFLRKTALQIVKAEARKQRGREDISRCCRGGDSGQGYPVWQVIHESFPSCERMWFIEEPRAK